MVPSSDLQKDIFQRCLSNAIAFDVHSFEIWIQRLEELRIMVAKVFRKLEN